MLRGNIVRLYPNKSQEKQIDINVDCSRFVYNWGLALQKRYYSLSGKKASKFDLVNRLPKLKKRYPFLKEADAWSLQNSISDLDNAYKHFFRKIKLGQQTSIRFKAKDIVKASFVCQMEVKVTNKKINIPKAKWIKARGIREEYLDGKLKRIAVQKRRDGKYEASLIFDIPEKTKWSLSSPDISFVGIDVGVKRFITDSDGYYVKPLDFRVINAKIDKLNEKYSKTKEKSQNRIKLRKKINRLHQKKKDKKKDQIEKVTNYYRGRNVQIEDINIKKMTEKKNISSFNRSMLEQNWGEFFVRLGQKVNIEKVDPKFTSQQCSKCNHISKQNRKSQSEFRCVKCEYIMNADYNAAVNIRNRGNLGDCFDFNKGDWIFNPYVEDKKLYDIIFFRK